MLPNQVCHKNKRRRYLIRNKKTQQNPPRLLHGQRGNEIHQVRETLNLRNDSGSGTEVDGQCQPPRLSNRTENCAKVATKRHAILDMVSAGCSTFGSYVHAVGSIHKHQDTSASAGRCQPKGKRLPSMPKEWTCFNNVSLKLGLEVAPQPAQPI